MEYDGRCLTEILFSGEGDYISGENISGGGGHNVWDRLYVTSQKHRRHVEVAVRDFGEKHYETGH